MSQTRSEAFEDGIDLPIGLVEAQIPSKKVNWPGYPLPQLSLLSDEEVRTFRTIVLENPYLRAVVLPGMGGRIVSLFDKRTGLEILRRHPAIQPQSGGRRGVFVREGIQILLDGKERLTALGNVNTQIEFQNEEEDETAIWLSETFTGTGIAYHARLSLPPDRAELCLEVRVTNRWLTPQPYNGGLSIYLGEGTYGDSTFYSTERPVGLHIAEIDLEMKGWQYCAGTLSLTRFDKTRVLAPRQSETWKVAIVPISGIQNPVASSREATVGLSLDGLQIQTSCQRPRHKIFLLTETEETLEAQVDLYPEHTLEMELGKNQPKGIILRDPAKIEILSYKAGRTRDELMSGDGNVDESQFQMPPQRDLTDRFDVATRHIAYTHLGITALHAKNFGEANRVFEQALLYNADDPLLWWSKAMSLRLKNEDNQAELLNAHYLAPLEPALKAESFLSQPIDLSAEPNPLLITLAENPEELIEVGCLLIECGLLDQASRWLDEALRHRDLSMLRYLMAYCLFSGPKLLAEASEQVRLAGLAPWGPPFPFRPMEQVVIQSLINAFPADQRLQVLGRYLEMG